MALLVEPWEAVLAFFEAGGGVLLVIFGVTFVLWVLITERIWYLRKVYPNDVVEALQLWRRRSDKTSWFADQVRTQLSSQIAHKLGHTLPMINTLVAICPLLGLLGTVSGMIEVFDVMAIAGNSNVRAMAAGVSKATIPTMAGMVAALSGLYFSVRLSRTANRERRRFEDQVSPT